MTTRTERLREKLRDRPTDDLELRAARIHAALLLMGHDGPPAIIRHLRGVRLAINVELIDRYCERAKHSGHDGRQGDTHA